MSELDEFYSPLRTRDLLTDAHCSYDIKVCPNQPQAVIKLVIFLQIKYLIVLVLIKNFIFLGLR